MFICLSEVFIEFDVHWFEWGVAWVYDILWGDDWVCLSEVMTKIEFYDFLWGDDWVWVLLYFCEVFKWA